MPFHLKLLPSLITVPAIIIMLVLGTWQLERLEWKQDFIDTLNARTNVQPISLPTELLTQSGDEFTPVYLEGMFDHSREVLLQNRTYEKSAGMHVLTPFVRGDGKGVVLVNRGWVPFEKPGQEYRKDSLVEGNKRIEGVIRFPIGQTSFVPDNNAEKDQWYFIDLGGMGDVMGYSLAPYYVMESKTGSDDVLPIGGQWKLTIPNNHLEYALTWYSLALILLVIFIVYHRKKT